MGVIFTTDARAKTFAMAAHSEPGRHILASIEEGENSSLSAKVAKCGIVEHACMKNFHHCCLMCMMSGKR